MNIISSGRPNGDKDQLLSNVALLYYGEGLTQGEIAKRMQVSRATIVNMLREARERGIVDIRVDGKHLTGSHLSRAIREKFGLADVYIAQTSQDIEQEPSRELMLRQMARVAATAIADIVEPGDRIGVAWGETIMAVANAMPISPTENVEISQLIGSMISERVPASENCAIQIANKLGATCYTLHSPGIVSSSELAEQMSKEPTIRKQLDRLKNLDMTIASVGNVSADTHLQVAGMASEDEMNVAKSNGAVGILCCRFIDRNGDVVELPPHERLIAARAEDLRAPKKKLLAVCGIDRVQATLAAIAGNLVTHLCIDQDLAENLLSAD